MWCNWEQASFDAEKLKENAPKIWNVELYKDSPFITSIQIDGQDYNKEDIKGSSSKCSSDSWTEIWGIGEKWEYGFTDYKYSLAWHTWILTRNSDGKTFYIGDQLNKNIQEQLWLSWGNKNNILGMSESVDISPVEKMDNVLQLIDQVKNDFFEYTEYAELFRFVVLNWSQISDEQVQDFKEYVVSYLADFDQVYGLPDINISADEIFLTAQPGNWTFIIKNSKLPDGELELYEGTNSRSKNEGTTRGL